MHSERARCRRRRGITRELIALVLSPSPTGSASRNQPAARPVYHSPPGGSVVICKPISQQHRVYRYICQANGPRLRLSPLSLPPNRINVFLASVVAVTLPLST